MQPETLNDLLRIQEFTLNYSDVRYHILKTGVAEYIMYAKGQEKKFVGYVTDFGYFFKLTHHLAGLTLAKEIAYSEIIVKK